MLILRLSSLLYEQGRRKHLRIGQTTIFFACSAREFFSALLANVGGQVNYGEDACPLPMHHPSMYTE